MTPTVDDPVLGADPTRNDDFSFNSVFPDDQKTQDRCPFAAHVRKTNPRADLATFGGTEIRRIIRSGIQFGSEVTAEEAKVSKTQHDRGLLFVSYQSNIPNGFQFIQHSKSQKFLILRRIVHKPQAGPITPVSLLRSLFSQALMPSSVKMEKIQPKSSR